MFTLLAVLRLTIDDLKVNEAREASKVCSRVAIPRSVARVQGVPLVRCQEEADELREAAAKGIRPLATRHQRTKWIMMNAGSGPIVQISLVYFYLLY